MHYITDTLLVGNAEDAERPAPFIEAILFVAGDYAIDPPGGVKFAQVPLVEFGEADPHDVLDAVEWLEENAPSQRLMVCCRAGLGRSVSMVIAYLCCVEGMSYDEALELVKARRPGATPLPNLEQTIQKVQQIRRARHAHGRTRGQEADPSPSSEAGSR